MALCEIELRLASEETPEPRVYSALIQSADQARFRDQVLLRESGYWALERLALLGHVGGDGHGDIEITSGEDEQVYFFANLFIELVSEFPRSADLTGRPALLDTACRYAYLTFPNFGLLGPIALLMEYYDGDIAAPDNLFLYRWPSGGARQSRSDELRTGLLGDVDQLRDAWEQYDRGALSWDEYLRLVTEAMIGN